ncbi:DUF6607 family protein [Haloferula sp. BvORR071]|uniref:DUF6607 family protein n=1 Tax=Haloferula sp. BvORR071 TaxID=1396141 RepID=UPI00069635BA|nr:DUF6607 family protein [Haloferula sp. BvORR071]
MKSIRQLALLAALLGCQAYADEEPKKEAEQPQAPAVAEEKPAPAGGHVFAWGFMDWEKMQTRGGTTQGTEVTLFTGSKESWKRLHQPGLDKFEQDRRAILALAGNYRVSFDFTETAGLAENFKPTRPYFSWGTENVTTLEDRGGFISLQHSLVMYFKNEKGEMEGPHVMKHWREDWTYQDPEMQVFQGDLTWKKVPTESPAGKWTQAVFQVDDSPRYESSGKWSHDGGLSMWRSDLRQRPLPRREFSIRKDYNVQQGTDEITLTPNGWVHVQSNRKLQINPDGSRQYVGQEIGVDRYEEIISPDLATPFNAYWVKTNGYWKDVRETWDKVLRERDSFSMKDTYDGKQLFMIHFEHAEEIEQAEKPDPTGDLKHAQETIRSFLN